MDAWAFVLVLTVPSDMRCGAGGTMKSRGFSPLLKAAGGYKNVYGTFSVRATFCTEDGALMPVAGVSGWCDAPCTSRRRRGMPCCQCGESSDC